MIGGIVESYRVRCGNVVTSRMVGLVFGLCTVAGPAFGQVVNPAGQAGEKPPAQTQEKPPEGKLRTWEMPPLDVYGKAPLHEEDRIGAYGQPRWTAHRRFSETRVYVVPEGMVEMEYWLVAKRKKDGSTSIANQYEMEFGLPHRLQLDIYVVGNQHGNEGSFAVDEQKIELRYALADWGKLPGNPTLYFEWKALSDEPDHAEVKLLLGGHITSGWHWGSNFVFEPQTGGPHEIGYEWTTGISHTVADSKFGLGLETQLALVNERAPGGGRTPFAKEFLIGPSLQLRPLPNAHLDFAPLFGVTKDAPRAKVFVVFGWEF